MNAFDGFQDARAAIQECDYQRALDQLVWFHNHALEEDKSLRGVRLSFALADWVRLGSLYPKALQTLHSIRDEKTSMLLSGKGTRQAFIDVSSINEYLEDVAATYDVFVHIKRNDAALAHACAGRALPAIVKAKDFVLAKEIYGDPNSFIRSKAASLNEDVEWSRSQSEMHQQATLNAIVSNYIGDVQMLLSTYEATDGKQQRQSLASLAVEQIEDEECRGEVASGIGA